MGNRRRFPVRTVTPQKPPRNIHTGRPWSWRKGTPSPRMNERMMRKQNPTKKLTPEARKGVPSERRSLELMLVCIGMTKPAKMPYKNAMVSLPF